jgi:hypothetical protein
MRFRLSDKELSKFNRFIDLYCLPVQYLNQKKVNISGWGSNSFALDRAIEIAQPKSIIEVGSWLGASAIHLANISSKKTKILCIDTFLGSNSILWEQGQVNLKLNFSEIFDQFSANIYLSKLDSRVYPLPMTSSSAAELLQNQGVLADLIYIDAGHSEREVYNDLLDFWPLTRKVLIGDDYSSAWPGVIKAANKFSEEHKLKLIELDHKFILIREDGIK